MSALEIALIIIGILFFIFLCVLIIRTLLFRPLKAEELVNEEISFNKERPIKTLQELIKFKTISFKDEKLEDYNEFLKFEEKLVELFPNVHRVCHKEKVSNKSLIYLWPGEDKTTSPVILMSHYDVVPTNDEEWSVDPFGGVIKDGYLYGRGTLDTKGTLNGVFSAVEHLIELNFIPKEDMYLCFSGNEETLSYGAPTIVDYFEEKGFTPSLVVDEGGAVVENVFPGVKQKAALVGIAEKGVAEIELVLKSSGGHASSPKPHTVVGELSQACVRVEADPFPRNLSVPVSQMFDTLGRHSSFLYRMIFANLWFFSDLLDKLNKKQGGELNALMRTTIAFTQMEGSKANNVIPPSAKMGINSRIMTGESTDEVVARIKKIIKNDNIEVNKLNFSEPSRISITDSEAFRKVEKAIKGTWGDIIVSPYLMFAASDSRHYGRISPYVYRFSPMELTKDDRERIHGNDERILLKSINDIVEFYIRLIKIL